MKGIILSGGNGTRLAPLTHVTSKQLLPVYDRPMIFYPIGTLIRAGIRDILIIIAPDREKEYKKLLGSGERFGATFSYEIQERPEGLAQALMIGEDFIGDCSVALILGDNIFEDDFSDAIRMYKSGAHIFAKQVPDPERFGVVRFDAKGRPEKIVEKPKTHMSPYAITGLYLFDKRAVGVAKNLEPSERGELEIVDIHNWYLSRGELKADMITGRWFDAGTFESLADVTEWARQSAKKNKNVTGTFIRASSPGGV